jgi:hypothetical protein
MNYVRLITPKWRVRRLGADCGPFGPAYDAAWNPDVPAVLRDAIWQEIIWFEQNLPVPSPRKDAFCVKSRALVSRRHLLVRRGSTRDDRSRVRPRVLAARGWRPGPQGLVRPCRHGPVPRQLAGRGEAHRRDAARLVLKR